MTDKLIPSGPRPIVMAIALALALLGCPAAPAQETVLYSFPLGDYFQGVIPSALTSDSAGNLFGTTIWGGGVGCTASAGCGEVFELSPEPDGTWVETTLYRFTGGLDGRNPSSGVIPDAAGNLYGVSGGSGTQCNDYSPCGNVFEVSPRAAGGWSEKVLFNFDGLDGFGPFGRLVFDKAGNLYGTTLYGGPGACWCGVAYELSQQPGGAWYEQVLYSFQNNGQDGHVLYSGLVFDAAGNLYGTASEGGAYGFGTVYSLAPHAGAKWSESTLYSFKLPSGGGGPTSEVILDGIGNLYGTTIEGGALGAGVVFELSPQAGGMWAETILHHFPRRGMQDGAFPEASLTFGPSGILYGSTNGGGAAGCYTKYLDGCGTAFKLTPQSGGGWAESILYNFRDKGRPGALPATSLIIDAAGNLFGTTTAGGRGKCRNGYGCGVVFELAAPLNK